MTATDADFENGAVAGHNAGERREIIVSTIRDLALLDAERKQISDEIREVKNVRIKGQLGMKISDFNAVRRLYDLENDDRNQFLDTLRETFEALGLGEQLDFLSGSASADDMLRRQAGAGEPDAAAA